MNASPRPAVQLYSIREFQEPLPDIIARVGETNFEGVEFAKRFLEADPETTAVALEQNELVPVAVHATLPHIEAAIDGENDLLARCETVGCNRLVVPHVPRRHFRNRQTVRSLTNRLTAVATQLKTCDIEFGYHMTRVDCYPFFPPVVEILLRSGALPQGVANHARRVFARIQQDGKSVLSKDTGLWNLFSRTRSENLLFFELESAEITAAGVDPATVLSQFEGCAPLVHLRDIELTGLFGAKENVQPSEGVVDFETLVETAFAENVEWLVYENETDRNPATKLTEMAAFLDRLLDVECPSGHESVVGSSE